MHACTHILMDTCMYIHIMTRMDAQVPEIKAKREAERVSASYEHPLTRTVLK